MICAAPRQRTCTVSIRAGPGTPYYSHVTIAGTLFQAVARAKEFFESDFWKGPKHQTGDRLPGDTVRR